jgi:hypothetical protein
MEWIVGSIKNKEPRTAADFSADRARKRVEGLFLHCKAEERAARRPMI